MTTQVFPIVYAPELHFPEFNSAIADMKNSVAVSNIIKVSFSGLSRTLKFLFVTMMYQRIEPWSVFELSVVLFIP